MKAVDWIKLAMLGIAISMTAALIFTKDPRERLIIAFGSFAGVAILLLILAIVALHA